MIDADITELINKAYSSAEIILIKSKKLLQETSEIFKREKYLDAESIQEIINKNHKYLAEFKIPI